MKKTLIALCGAAVTLLLTVNFYSKNIKNYSEKELDSLYATLTQEQKHDLKYAEGALQVAEGLEAKLFAAEPTITNPTNIEIDHRGRVWVLEAYNYRPGITGNAPKPEGDRIMILEDTDHDGVSDVSKVFYQDKTLNAPLGIMVLGNKVLVSQSPYVFLLTDENGDDVADKKEIIFEGVGGEQHDHGIHAFVFGPDGKFYFNFGNSGGQLLDANHKPVADIEGRIINNQNFKQGLVFRCDQDFKNIEVLGQNFRNNFELAVDSYGTMWQSDNDDDGNRAVRLNYVMQHGNYGFVDEMTGASWRANRTNIEASTPESHWHLNDPGVVPNLIHTGAGSPTGITVYEGDALPSRFRNQILHCDAGINAVRGYSMKKDGAGYTTNFDNIVFGKRNQWFRPSDVCVAPDGSLFVSDWYDPGVGGHQVGDLNRGRIYRIGTNGSNYTPPTADVATVTGVMKAILSPNMAVRYLAWNTLHQSGALAEAALQQMYDTAPNARHKARALWLLSKLPTGQKHIETALKSQNPDLKVAAIRAAYEIPSIFETLDLTPLVQDQDPQIRRELALALRKSTHSKAAEAWAWLAKAYDGNSRWELEALGIGADGRWDSYLDEYLKLNDDPLASKAGRDIIWRARTEKTLPYLAKLASENNVELKDRLRYFRAFDFNPATTEKYQVLLNIMKYDGGNEITKICFRHLDPTFVKTSLEASGGLKKLLETTYGTREYIELVQRFEPITENTKLLNLAIEKSNSSIGSDAIRQLFKQNGTTLIWQVIDGKNLNKTLNIISALKSIGNKNSLEILENIALDPKRSKTLRSEATKAIGGSWNGEGMILDLLKKNKIPKEYIAAAVQGVSGAWRQKVRNEAATYLGITKAPEGQKHPAIAELLGMKGNADNGKKIFANYCAICHQANGEGQDFGPKLSEIGSKLPKDGQYLAIMYPNAGVSFGYETHEIRFKDGSKAMAILASKTESDLILKFPGGITQSYKMTQVAAIKKLDESMMTPNLHENMKTQELVDLVEYLASLKKQ